MLSIRPQRGFNLLEAVVAVSVLGILIAGSLPSVASWIRATEMRSVAEAVQVGLQKARIEALRRNQIVTFWLVTMPEPAASLGDGCTLSATSASWVVSLDTPVDHCGSAASPTVAPRIVETHGAGKAALSFAISGLKPGGSVAAANSVSFNGYGQVVASSDRLSRIDISHPEVGQRSFSVEISPSGGVRMCDRGVDKATGDPRACEQSP